ncbi:MAG: ribosome-associated translation inhibitor RaiA [Flavobacteriales bacterium]|nr:ribosome-associated translation inhibitor RaiA [Flavobacteriales bacterium]
MKLSVNVIDVNDSESLKAHVEKRIDKLKTVYDEILSAEVIIKKNKAMDPSPKTVEMKLHVAGTDLFASKESDKSEEAIDLAFEALNRQLIKFKETKK